MKSLLLLLFAATAYSQNESIPLHEWRMKTGDDARWAEPNFDDSNWAAGALPAGIRRIDQGGPMPVEKTTWFRTTVPIAELWKRQKLSLGIGPLDAVYEVFVNGIRIGGIGSMPPPGEPFSDSRAITAYTPSHIAFPVPGAFSETTDLLVAIRAYRLRPGFGRISVLGQVQYSHDPTLGLALSTEQGEQLHTVSGFVGVAPNNFLWLVAGFCGVVCLWLYSRRPREIELLWLGLALSFNGSARIFGLPVNLSMISVNSLASFLLHWIPFFCVHFFYCMLLAELIPPARRWIRATAWAIAFASMIGGFAAYFDLHFDATTLEVARDLGVFVQCILGLAAGWYNVRDRRWDFAALGLCVTLRASSLFLSSAPSPVSSPSIGHVSIEAVAFGNAAVAIGLACIAGLRSKRRSAQQRETEREMEAAGRVQAAILAAGSPDLDRFEVATAYHPAKQVGGDFYFFSPSASDGSLLVVVGDVSGKGLQAAMLVASVIGSLRNEDSRSPGEVLARLNRSLADRCSGGFVTCCCARFDRNGSACLANAGNLAPYVDRREVELESGLPLGLMHEVEYEESVIQGDCFTFVSDGVVEAANERGELFGFDRTREISGKPAQEIADAAKAWGQNDDITVVTVKRKNS